MSEHITQGDRENTSQTSTVESPWGGVLSCTPAQTWPLEKPQDDEFSYAVGSAAVGYEPIAKAILHAQENARTELSKQFVVRIESNTNLVRESHRTNNGTRYKTTLVEKTNSLVPPIEIPGVKIVERCVDQRTHTVFALAKLDREKAIEGLQRKISQIDEEIGTYMSVSSALPTTEQIRRLLPSLVLVENRKILANSLSHIQGYPPAGALKNIAVERRIDSLFDSMSIALHPGSQDAKSIEPYVAKRLANQGFRISSRGIADITLKYQIEMRSVVDHGIYFVYANGEMAVIESDGRLMNLFKVDAKGGSSLSISHAREDAAEQIGQQLGELVVEYLLAGL